MALVDDDAHSAHLLTRALKASGAPAVHWFGGAADAQDRLASALFAEGAARPGLVIVDLKSHSGANADFLRGINPLARQAGTLMVAMSQCSKQTTRDALLEAGATTVFTRHADVAAYRREAASLVDFWARSQRAEPVGM